MRTILFLHLPVILSIGHTQIFWKSFTPLKITIDVVSRRKYNRTTPPPVMKQFGLSLSQIDISSSGIKSSPSTTTDKMGLGQVQTPSRPLNRFISGNIEEQVITQANQTILALKSIHENIVDAKKYLQPIFKSSKCFNSLQDATSLIEQGTELISNTFSDKTSHRGEKKY